METRVTDGSTDHEATVPDFADIEPGDAIDIH
jgi:hypothetical protein